MMRDDLWTGERDSMLRRLWGLGWTASKIAEAMTTTRSAVIGRKSRLGLASRPLHPNFTKPRLPKIPKPPKPVVVRLNPMPRVIGMAMQAQRKFAEGNSPFKSCQFIAGTGRPWTKCGVPTVPGHSWCQGHCERVYRPRESGETA